MRIDIKTATAHGKAIVAVSTRTLTQGHWEGLLGSAAGPGDARSGRSGHWPLWKFRPLGVLSVGEEASGEGGTGGEGWESLKPPVPKIRKLAERLPFSRKKALTGQSSRPWGPARLCSQGIKPHGDCGHHDAESEDPSDEWRLGEAAEQGLPSGGLHRNRVLRPAAGTVAKPCCR